MNQERRSVESTHTNAICLPAISLPVAERQGYQQLTTAPVAPPDSRPAFLTQSERATASLVVPADRSRQSFQSLKKWKATRSVSFEIVLFWIYAPQGQP